MKIAILMSSYNGCKFIEKQLLSLAAQTVSKDINVYIRDDGSTDNTCQIIEKWKKKMNITLYKENNVGVARSFWKLFMNNEIHADYYAFCDQDDVWDKDKLEIAINKLTRNNASLYASNCRIIDENDNVIILKRKREVPNINIFHLFVTGVTQGCSMVFTDNLLRYIRHCNIQCMPMHDIIVMLYALQYGKIYWDEVPRFSYRMHSNNVVAKNNKNFCNKIKTTYRNWKNSANNSMAKVASELLNNCNNLSETDKRYLLAVKNYKKSLSNKFKILNKKEFGNVDKSCLRSYQIRVLLNIY